MGTSLDTRILLARDKEAIVQFETTLLKKAGGDPVENELKSWSARWRGEALDHYLPQGWSFGCWLEEQLQGYFIGQPYLFHRGLTQTLWIEHLSARNPEVAVQLIDTAHRWARDKHLQAVLMENQPSTTFVLEEFPKACLLNDGLIELKSARF